MRGKEGIVMKNKIEKFECSGLDEAKAQIC